MASPWKALSDDNRRQMLVILKDGEKTPKEIASSFRFTLSGVSTHLRVLKEAGLVSERKVGLNRFYSINRERLLELVDFFDLFWTDSLIRLKEHAEEKSKAKKG